MFEALILNGLQVQVQRLTLWNLKGEAILTDGGQKTVVSPYRCIRVETNRQDEQLGWVSSPVSIYTCGGNQSA